MKLRILAAVLVVLLSGNIFAQDLDTTALKPKSHFGKEALLATQILDTYHFRKINLNDSLSQVILKEYIATLDNNKSYFLQSDIDEFDVYANKIDDLVQASSVKPAYIIYDRFRERFDQRMSYIYDRLLDYQFDFTLDEEYDTDRTTTAYASSNEELNDLWRKIIKGQVLSLKLSGKEEGEIKETITKRYDRFKKAISQYNSDDIFELYMNAIAEAYDPHSNYFSAKTSERFQQNMSLSLEGIGARLQLDNDFTKIVEILPGGPAMKSGILKSNDRIVAVGQGEQGEMVDVIGWRLDDVVQLIKGPKGTTVRLDYLPAETGVNGPSQRITLVREKIKLEELEAKAEIIPVIRNGQSYDLGVIKLPSFYMDFEAYQRGDVNYNSTTRDVKKLVEELKEKNIDGLMIDLRNNGGGSLSEAIDLTGLFIKDGPVVQVKTAANKIEVGADEDSEIIYDGPLTIMINRFSASASEIFAGAIQDYGRGVVLGETSYGKGTVQSVIDMGRYMNVPDGEKVGQLKLTLQKFYRVTGSSTQHLGVNPDVIFPSAFEAEEFGESSKPSALPWDQIKGTRYKPTEVVSDKLIAQLQEDFQQRLTDDENLSELALETAELKNSLSESIISLNEAKRRIELEEAEKRKAERTNLTGVTIDKEGIKQGDRIETDDKYLREGLVVLSDIISAIG